MEEPTDRQLEVLRIVSEHVEIHGWAPTYREICDALGLVSLQTNAVKDHLDALVRKGLLTRAPGFARALRITDAGRAVLGQAA